VKLLPLKAYVGRRQRGDWEYQLRVDDRWWLRQEEVAP
jgi:hypothetical protein